MTILEGRLPRTMKGKYRNKQSNAKSYCSRLDFYLRQNIITALIFIIWIYTVCSATMKLSIITAFKKL